MSSHLRIFLCTTPTKMTYSFDSLMGQAQEIFDLDPTSGHLFLEPNIPSGCAPVASRGRVLDTVMGANQFQVEAVA